MAKEDLIRLLGKAGNCHQKLYRDAMNGLGIDRHLFALYVVSKGLGYVSIDSTADRKVGLFIVYVRK